MTLFGILTFIIFYLINSDVNSLKKTFCDSYCDEYNYVKNKEIPQYWLDKYGIEIKDESDLTADIDNDGLILRQEYKYFTNPLNPDTDGDGYKDGKEVRDGYNPLGEGRLDIDGDRLPDNWEEKYGLSLSDNDYNLDPDNDGLLNYLEYKYGTNPLEADTDGDGYNDLHEIRNGYDPDAPGSLRPEYTLIIKKIKVSVPIIWSKSFLEDDMLEELKSGVVLYPKTGVPGQNGNAVISGHSSNYIWVKGKYNYVFRKLNNLKIGDKINIKVKQKNGKEFNYNYIVSMKKVVVADDGKIFAETKKPAITLVTCWPLGTNWKRLMVRAYIE